jgi:hypothetical protein
MLSIQVRSGEVLDDWLQWLQTVGTHRTSAGADQDKLAFFSVFTALSSSSWVNRYIT